MAPSNMTIFAIPKPFVGLTGIIQRNAIISWTKIQPRPEIVLLGCEEGTKEIASEFSLVHVSEIDCNAHGTPLMSSALALIQRETSNDIFCYVNSDIILLPSFVERTNIHRFSRYLLIGRRTNLCVTELIDFSATNWEQELMRRVGQEGELHSHWGIDYFVFPRVLWNQIPAFAIGRLMWDNWLIYDTSRRRIPVIDATPAIDVIHQNHPSTSSIVLEDGSWNWTDSEVQSNLALAGGHGSAYNVYDSTWTLYRWGLFPAIGHQYLRQKINRVDGSNNTTRLWRAILSVPVVLNRILAYVLDIISS